MPNPGTKNEFRTQKIHKMSLRQETNKNPMEDFIALIFFFFEL